MNKDQAKAKIMSGNLIDCSAEEYYHVRRYLQEFARESIDNGRTIYAAIALDEVKRLDQKFAAVEHSVQRTCYTCGTPLIDIGNNSIYCPNKCHAI